MRNNFTAPKLINKSSTSTIKQQNTRRSRKTWEFSLRPALGERADRERSKNAAAAQWSVDFVCSADWDFGLAIVCSPGTFLQLFVPAVCTLIGCAAMHARPAAQTHSQTDTRSALLSLSLLRIRTRAAKRDLLFLLSPSCACGNRHSRVVFICAHCPDAGERNFKAVQICKLVAFEFVFAHSNKMISSLQNFFARH